MMKSSEEIRTFIAVELPAEVKSFLQRVAADLKKTGADVKWTRAEGTHLTLKFLGNIRTDVTSLIDAQLRPALSSIKPFALSVRGLGAFPSLARPRVFWAGIHDPEQALPLVSCQVE